MSRRMSWRWLLPGVDQWPWMSRRPLISSAAAWKKWPPAAVGAALVVGSAIAFALDGPVAQAAYQQGLEPAAFGFWRALAGAMLLGGCLAARRRSFPLARIGRMRRVAVIRLTLAAVAGLGLNLALFEAFARLPVAVTVAAFGCYPLFVAGWEAACRRSAGGAVTVGMAAVAIGGLLLLIRPDRSASASVAGVLLALLAAVLHAAYILLGRRGWDQAGDGAATFLIVATAALGLGAMAAAAEGALAGAAAPVMFLAGLRRIGATRTAVLSLCESLVATLLAAVAFGQLKLLGGALLLSAGIAVQTVPARPPRPARGGQGPPHRQLSGRLCPPQQSGRTRHGRDHGNQDDQNQARR